MKRVLYVGSGNSAILAKNKDLSYYSHKICVNNAWRIFENSSFDVWIHSGDFPIENFPSQRNFLQEVSTKQYDTSAKNIAKKLNLSVSHPDHHLGYTIFFLGLYWILDTIVPDEIHLLGFDHDYNVKKVQKWLGGNKPNPQNGYLKSKNQSLKDWSENFFKGLDKDFFYGHGTPDPLRLGSEHLKEKFIQAENYSKVLNTKIYNASPIISNINIFEKIQVECLISDEFEKLSQNEPINLEIPQSNFVPPSQINPQKTQQKINKLEKEKIKNLMINQKRLKSNLNKLFRR